MPRTIPLDHDVQPEEVLGAMKVLGSSVNIRIVRFFRSRKSAFMGDILKGTGLNPSTLGVHLKQLEGIRVIKADIPPDQRHGRSINYSVDIERIQELSEQQLDYLIGEDPEEQSSRE